MWKSLSTRSDQVSDTTPNEALNGNRDSPQTRTGGRWDGHFGAHERMERA